MKTEGLRKSKNVVKNFAPSDGYKNTSMFKTYSRKEAEKHLNAGKIKKGPRVGR